MENSNQMTVNSVEVRKEFHPVGIFGESYSSQQCVNEVQSLTENLGSHNHSGIKIAPHCNDIGRICITIPKRNNMEFMDFRMLEMYGYQITDILYYDFNGGEIWVWINKERQLLNQRYGKESKN